MPPNHEYVPGMFPISGTHPESVPVPLKGERTQGPYSSTKKRNVLGLDRNAHRERTCGGLQ